MPFRPTCKFVGPGNAFALINDPDEGRFVGQSFTAGMNARLTRVYLNIERHEANLSQADFELSIWNAPQDLPVGSALATLLIPREQLLFPPNRGFVDLPVPVPMVEGQKYALILQAHNAVPGVDPYAGRWIGDLNTSSHSTYPRGVALHGSDLSTMKTWPDYDLSFRTIVEVPEPSSAMLLAVLPSLSRRRVWE